ncbi:dihydrofolate reductase family protein [Nocardia araoensis]|uniref:dihydrofolate reductase family protein n=1 Tax=Nocardia araoensis TaxID=228600 RepID=UPI0002D3CA74|nr:dihydrofolate reductase family protein [Nocardia araoensis]
MGTIVQSTLISIDGVVDDPGSWAMSYFDDDSGRDAVELLRQSDAMLLGRNTYRELVARWASETGPFAEAINGIPKYIFSRTLATAAWANAEIVTDDVIQTVARLKNEENRNLVTYGYGPLGRTLLENGLLDELRFAVHPIIVGNPTAPFRTNPRTPLRLVDPRSRRSGVTVMIYRTK